nr:MAG TPA: TFIIB zinc-binding [Caudoviricetes sp.]
MNNADTISRSAAIKALRQWRVAISTERAVAEVEHLPSIQTPVVHGRWKTINGKGCFTGGGNPLWGCSKCRHIIGAMLLPPKYNYCPNCGAKMDGGKDDGK